MCWRRKDRRHFWGPMDKDLMPITITIIITTNAIDPIITTIIIVVVEEIIVEVETAVADMIIILEVDMERTVTIVFETTVVEMAAIIEE